MSEHRFDEILIERPRTGMRLSSRRLPGARRQLDWVTQEAIEDGLLSPYRIKVRSKTKWLSDHLGPMKRFLRSKVGQPWDEVYQELSIKMDLTTLQGQHLMSHLRQFVVDKVEFVEGILYAKSSPFGNNYFPLNNRWGDQFFVHPETGLLDCLPKQSHPPTESTPVQRLVIDRTREYHQIDQIWYLITFAELFPWDRAWDVLLKIHCDSDFATRHYGRCIYAQTKRQCNKRELKNIQARLQLVFSSNL